MDFHISRRMVTTLYFNGEKMFTRLHDTAKGLNKWFGSGQWFLGQDQDTLGGSFEKQQSLSGTLSHINIWNRIITDEEVQEMANCSGSFAKDFGWEQDSLYKTFRENMRLGRVCRFLKFSRDFRKNLGKLENFGWEIYLEGKLTQ